jgi:hypothetical protein
MRFGLYLVQVDNLVTLTNRGVRHVVGYPGLLEMFKTDKGDPAWDADERRLVGAKKMARLAQEEIAKDFPLLHSHAVIGMWGALEAMVEDLAVSWLEHNPAALSVPAVSKIRVPFAEFQGMDQQDRLRFLVAELQRELRVDLKSGATKFELLLTTLGLGGPVDKRIRDVLYETQNLRNAFAHRGGVADRRFIANCPQFQYCIGDEIKVDTNYFSHILNGLLMYDQTVLNRCRAIDGLSPLAMESPGYEGALPVADEAE